MDEGRQQGLADFAPESLGIQIWYTEGAQILALRKKNYCVKRTESTGVNASTKCKHQKKMLYGSINNFEKSADAVIW